MFSFVFCSYEPLHYRVSYNLQFFSSSVVFQQWACARYHWSYTHVCIVLLATDCFYSGIYFVKCNLSVACEL